MIGPTMPIDTPSSRPACFDLDRQTIPLERRGQVGGIEVRPCAVAHHPETALEFESPDRSGDVKEPSIRR